MVIGRNPVYFPLREINWRTSVARQMKCGMVIAHKYETFCYCKHQRECETVSLLFENVTCLK